MIYHKLADLVVLIHFAFIVFVLTGGLLVLRWRPVVWIHLPSVLWAAFIEFAGWICPLTPLENWLRLKSGGRIYSSDFIEHYLMSLVYPDALTPQMQVILGVGVIIVNLVIYVFLLRRKGRLFG
jgi:hypothetical protein